MSVENTCNTLSTLISYLLNDRTCLLNHRIPTLYPHFDRSDLVFWWTLSHSPERWSPHSHCRIAGSIFPLDPLQCRTPLYTPRSLWMNLFALTLNRTYTSTIAKKVTTQQRNWLHFELVNYKVPPTSDGRFRKKLRNICESFVSSQWFGARTNLHVTWFQ